MGKNIIARILPGVILAFMLTSCGGGLFSSKLGSEAENRAAGISLERMDHHLAAAPAGLVSQRIVNEGEFTVVELSCLEAEAIYEILLNVNYPADSMSFESIEIHDPLGPEEEVLEMVHTKQPGLVAIGQVRHGLTTVSLQAGAPFATIRLRNSPSRQTAVAVEDVGLKLRENLEFLEADVPLKVEESGQYVVVTWEVANDGDYDNNGEVNIADITPVGMYYVPPPNEWGMVEGKHFILDESGEDPVVSVVRDMDLADTMRDKPAEALILRNMGTVASPAGYAPVERLDNNHDTLDPLVDDKVYIVTQADLVPIGANFGNTVVSYDVYQLEVPDSEVPDGDENINNAFRMNDDGNGNRDPIIVPRAEELNSIRLTEMGLDLFVDPDVPASDNYAWFCENVCTADDERGGNPPVAEEKQMFKFAFIPEETEYDDYVAVVPRATTGAVDVEDLGAYTYHEIDSLVTHVDEPSGISWTGGTGITDMERTDASGTPDEDGLGFRIKFGTASLDDNPDDAWEVRYGIFISENSGTLFYNTDEEVSNLGYPAENAKYPATIRTTGTIGNLIDIEETEKDANGWLYFDVNGDIANKTLYVGVRAYAYRTKMYNMEPVRYSFSYSNDPVENEPFDYTLVPTGEGEPDFSGMKYQDLPVQVQWRAFHDDIVTPFYPVYGITTEPKVAWPDEDSSTYLYTLDFFEVEHPDATSGEAGTTCYIRNFPLVDGLQDYDAAGNPIGPENLTMRIEIYRTTDSYEDFVAFMDDDHTVQDWVEDTSETSKTLYAVAMNGAVRESIQTIPPFVNSVLPLNFPGNPDPQVYDAYMFTIVPPFNEPASGFRAMDNTDSDLTFSVEPDFEIADYYTPLYESDGNGGFSRVGLAEDRHDIRFVYHETLEVENSIRYNYVAVAAILDDEGYNVYDND